MKVSIYVAAHKPSKFLEGETFIPMHVGRCGRLPSFCDVGDDTFAHISNKNDSFCELTAMYWIWQNTKDQDYVGLLHYRRHLNLSGKEAAEDKWGLVQHEAINKHYIEANDLTDDGVLSFVEGFDMILPKPWDVRKAGSKSLMDHFRKAPHQNVSDYEAALQIIRRAHPAYAPFIDKVNNGHAGYFTNVFILRREIFDQYCDWLFDILFELERTRDIESYSVQERRVFGFISEWLFNIFIQKVIADNPNLKIREAQRTFVVDTDPETVIQPRAATKNVPIVMAFEDAFSPYAGTAIRSIIEHSSPEYSYDLLIFDRNISSHNKDIFRRMIAPHGNFGIRFLPPPPQMRSMTLPVQFHISRDTYFRLYIPEVFSAFERIVYIDADMVALRDIAELYEQPLNGKSIGAAIDYPMKNFRKQKRRTSPDNVEVNEYLSNHLGMRTPEKYFQAGLLIYDTAAASKSLDRIKDALGSGKQYWYMDQDILNMVYHGDVEFLDPRWNVLHGNGDTNTFFEALPAAARNEYFRSRENPWIIHFAGGRKPWKNLSVDFSDVFWRFARQTPWYEQMLVDLVPRPVVQEAPPPTPPIAVQQPIEAGDIWRAIKYVPRDTMREVRRKLRSPRN